MKRALIFAVLAAAVAVCASAMVGGTPQPPAMTDPFEWPSQTPDYSASGQSIAADDWKCTDGLPIGIVRWWGDYHAPTPAGEHPSHTPPAFQPTAFILKQYADDGGKPGNLLNEVLMPIADCKQAFVGEATLTGDFFIAVFGYEAALPAPWAQTKDGIYWLSVQAQFSRVPDISIDGFVHWGWLGTPPGDFLGTGQSSGDGTTWTPIVFIDPEEKNNFAFEIGALPVGVAANKATFAQSDSISVMADVAAIATPCWPFVRIRQPNDEVLYLDQSRGFVAGVTPYLGIEAGPIALPKIDDYPILQDALFRDMPKGTYVLEGGAVDPVTTDINNLQYVGVVSSQELLIE